MIRTDQILATAKRVGEITAKKNFNYGDAVGVTKQILIVLYPMGIRVDQYEDSMLIVRIIDKMCRIATNKEAFEESPFLDIAGYGLMGEVLNQSKKEIKQNECGTIAETIDRR